jgi:hypothetical protein
MRSRLSISPATVIACLALFFALGGGASLAAQQFINGSKIAPHSITAKQLSKKTVVALKGDRGPAGPAGVQGLPGVAGVGSSSPSSANGISSTSIKVITDTLTVLPNNETSQRVYCPSGYLATGGGGGYGVGTSGTTNGVTNFYLEGSSPVLDDNQQPKGWSVGGYNQLPATYNTPIYVICVKTAN